MKRRVVITGMGVLTPLAQDAETFWRRLQEGVSGIAPITLFDASTYPTKIAGEVKDFSFESLGEGREKYESTGRNIWMAIAAARQAVAHAGLLPGPDRKIDSERAGLYLGAGEGRQDFLRFTNIIGHCYNADSKEVDTARFLDEAFEQLNGAHEHEQEPGRSSMHLADIFQLNGPNVNCLTACAASSQAIGEATEIIRRGDADIMVSGGTHSMIHPFGVAGFNLLTALSTRNDDPTKASRPFDRDRDGFVIGEGAGFVVLEELEHAKARGAQIYGELKGYGSTADAFRVTDTHPGGRGANACIKAALADAGLENESIDYINAHGTSTDVNDRVESIAIKEVFGDQAYKIPVSSIKSMTGHLIAAAGSVELITCLLAIRDNVVPPTINYETPDPDCDLDYVPNEARQVPVNHALSNSFGFGGQNISLVVSRFAG